MECQELQRSELAEKYLNGQLDPAAQDQFELHILDCPGCQQSVELLQSIRDDLVEHAPEIRTYSRVRRSGFRWAWPAVAALVVLVSAVGVYQLERLHRAPTGPQIATNQPPSVGAAPTPGLNMSGQRGRSNQVNVDGADASDNSANGVRSHSLKSAPQDGKAAEKTEKVEVSAIPDLIETTRSTTTDPVDRRRIDNLPIAQVPAESSTDTRSRATVTAEPLASPVADEVAQLATVQALPYTFAGVASSQPKGAAKGTTNHQTASAIAGNTGTLPNAGASGFTTAQDYFRDGMSAYVSRDYEAAANQLGEAIKLDPEFSEANLYLGISRLLQGKAADAVPALQAAPELAKPAVAQAAHFYLAKAYLQTGKLADAANEFHAAALIPGRLSGQSTVLAQRLDTIRSKH